MVSFARRCLSVADSIRRMQARSQASAGRERKQDLPKEVGCTQKSLQMALGWACKVSACWRASLRCWQHLCRTSLVNPTKHFTSTFLCDLMDAGTISASQRPSPWRVGVSCRSAQHDVDQLACLAVSGWRLPLERLPGTQFV